MHARDRRRSVVAAAALTILTTLALGACGPTPIGGAAAPGPSDAPLSLVGFAVPKAAHDEAQRAFAATEEGSATTWTTSFGASGDQSRAVASGLDADVVHFSLEGDVTRLVDAGIVADTWDDGTHAGIISTSVVVLVVREGNPKNIRGWDDLVRDDVTIVTPNPGSSGSARWNILGAYGAALADGGTPTSAEAYLRDFFNHVVALPGSGRDATTAFTSGTGDVLISYENEAILARQQGESFEYVVPEATLLIENPGAVTKDADPRGQRYLDFVLSPAGQRIFASKGFRPVTDVADITVAGANEPGAPFPVPSHLFTVDDLGGWTAVNAQFFADDGLVTRIQQELGAS
ncbi:sulfate ABC transporter substrate-binding protein [Sanguibacter sp. A247]|uniref:sulfate ABC transporter substrate-binding protein n=1 Tax=unclassified Sanguibacter TaxID=2645534 RepID=UPI003FD6D247